MENLENLKPSHIIRLAISAFKECREDPNYTISMDYWHQPDDFGKCRICFAGAVMAKVLNCDRTKVYSPTEFGEKTRDILLWLWFISEGDFNSYPSTGLKLPEYKKSVYLVDDITKDFFGWRNQLLHYATFLEKQGF